MKLPEFNVGRLLGLKMLNRKLGNWCFLGVLWNWKMLKRGVL